MCFVFVDVLRIGASWSTDLFVGLVLVGLGATVAVGGVATDMSTCPAFELMGTSIMVLCTVESMSSPKPPRIVTCAGSGTIDLRDMGKVRGIVAFFEVGNGIVQGGVYAPFTPSAFTTS